MQYAIVDGRRQKAQPALAGSCPSCARRMVSKCGPKIVWHWSHGSQRHCDKWWESETPWHLYWKGLFPEESREVIHVDPETSERHIADVKTAGGLVIELQNSPMPPGELQSRETFYKRMIWIVNAAPFASQFHMLDKLPDPKSPMAQDLVFRRKKHDWVGCTFWRKSENPEGDGALVLAHSTSEIAAELQQNYSGHHLFDWIRPRTVWFDATTPVFLDFGGALLHRLMTYDERGLRCIQLIAKESLVATNGGTFVPFAIANIIST